MNLLLTGSTGRVGSELVSRLLGKTRLILLLRDASAAGCERALRLLDPAARQAWRAGQLEFVAGDLEQSGLGLEPAAFGALRARVDRIVHLAGLTEFDDRGDDRHERVNVGGARRIGALAAEARIPVVFASTAYVCGDHAGMFREDDGALGQRFRNPYERSKLAAEAALRTLARDFDFPLAICRLGIVLPDAPQPDLPTGPGPLVFLEFLSGMEVRRAALRKLVRYAGDSNALLNLVTSRGVADVLATAALRREPVAGTFHLTSAHPTRVAALAERVNAELSALEIALVKPPELSDADRVERMLARHCKPYEPYLFAQTVHDRSRLLAEFGPGAGERLEIDPERLSSIFANHVVAWRGVRRRVAGRTTDESAVAEYFAAFLPARTGKRLVPGLESLSVEFTVSVDRVGIFRLAIDRGILTSVCPAKRRSDEIDYETEASAFLAAISGVVRPSQLFFERRVTLRGDLHRALTTATALEDFFRLHPFATREAQSA